MNQSKGKKTRNNTALLYVRLSRDDNMDGDSYSIQNQKTLLTKAAKDKGYTNLIFDVALPFDMKGKEKQIKKGVDAYLAEMQQDTYYTVITFDPEAFNKE